MKFSVLLLFGIFTQVYGFSIPKVYNTKAEGCVNERCGPHCDVNGVKIFPGERFNLEGECERLSCTQDFTVTFSTCRGFDSEWMYFNYLIQRFYYDFVS
ncbi:CLUMA_CG018489, isoform A [Clunio marinus]|uniref:CLUMA_CG018489, isoform A n=1 Tax=Clunio marinus TaxID=568069 RepID=A0A1J1J0U0_9DIPT|nr:CLUMA_CG018489, isoform A [Clunio marinus]